MTLDPGKTILRFPDDSGRSLAEAIGESPDGCVLELAPGRYEGPLVLRRPITIRGAGDLTRIVSEGPVVVVEGPAEGQIEIASVLVEGGRAGQGAGIRIATGSVRLFNVHVRHSEAAEGGGAVAIERGALAATKLRVHDVRAGEGGALWVGPEARLVLEDSQLEEIEAKRGGAICVRGAAQVSLRGVTIRRSRALTPSGGQAVFVAGDASGVPTMMFERVRLEDAPLGLPLVVDADRPPLVEVIGCDMPRIVLDTPGVIDGGSNDWR